MASDLSGPIGPAARTLGREARAIAPPDPWDPLIRIVHWYVAVAVLANGLINKPGGVWHVWLGWGVIILLGLRLVWGFVGPAEARFAAFPPNPRAALSHLGTLVRGRVRDYPSHNPAGAMMIYALWFCLATVIVTGLVMTDAKTPMTIGREQAAVAAGDWSVLVADTGDGEASGTAEDGESSGHLVREVHGLAANLILILALVHLGGVLIESRASRRNLIRPMLVGRGKGSR